MGRVACNRQLHASSNGNALINNVIASAALPRETLVSVLPATALWPNPVWMASMHEVQLRYKYLYMQEYVCKVINSGCYSKVQSR